MMATHIQPIVQGSNCEQWIGFTELFLGKKQEDLRSSRRTHTNKSDNGLQAEEVQQKLRHEMLKGLADKDMDFTPRETDSWERQGHVWIRHHLKPRRSMFMQDPDSGPRASEIKPFRLTRAIQIQSQGGYTPFHDQLDQVDCNDSSSYLTELPYEWKGITVFIKKEDTQSKPDVTII